MGRRLCWLVTGLNKEEVLDEKEEGSECPERLHERQQFFRTTTVDLNKFIPSSKLEPGHGLGQHVVINVPQLLLIQRSPIQIGGRPCTSSPPSVLVQPTS